MKLWYSCLWQVMGALTSRTDVMKDSIMFLRMLAIFNFYEK